MNINLLSKFAITIFILGLSNASLTFAAEQATDDSETAREKSESTDKPEMPPGILPIPDYTRDLSHNSYLTGDFNGLRTEVANNDGLQWNIDTVTWTNQVTSGGKSDDVEVGGNVTYNLNWDLMRAGILPGALISVRAETRWGSSGILNTGQAVPMSTAALSPTNYSDPDEGYGLALTNLSYLQMLSTKFGIIAGKLDLYGDGDPNEFAGGRGRTQFMNWSLNYGTANILVPATTLGAGVVFLPSNKLTIASLLISGTDCIEGNCFKDLDDKGGISITSAIYQYQLGGLPGGVAGNFIYMFDKDFETLDGQLPIPPPPGWEGSPKQDHSWIAGGSFWQYISTQEATEGPLNLTNRQQDLAGWGIFGRLTLADDDTNPWKTSVALGLGARGVIASRPNDMFGLGYFYNKLSSKGFVEKIDDGKGLEAYYNAEILQSVRLSLNLQWTNALVPSVEDDSFIVSTRLQIVF